MPDTIASEPPRLPPWATDLFQAFSAHVKDLARVLDLSMRGISLLRGQRQFLNLAIAVDGREATAAEIAHAEEESALAQSEVDNGFPLLHEQATVALWGSLETLVRSFVASWLENRSEAWQADAVRRLKVRLGDFQSLQPADRCLWVTDLLDQEIGGPLRTGVGRFEALLAPFSLSGPVEAEAQRMLFELSQVRNAVVHRRGIADRRLVDACPWLGLAVGDRLRVTHKMWNGYCTASFVYGLELCQRARAAYGVQRWAPTPGEPSGPPRAV
jgi:hypothetical protein